jgi:hypothetical protein
MKMKQVVLLSGALMLTSGAAIAQSPPTPTTPPAPTAPSTTPLANDCSVTQPAAPRGPEAPAGTTTGQRGEPLGDRLARSDGVLCPPAGVDPEIRAPTPNTGNTPVIPPPGSPGGDPNVRPK